MARTWLSVINALGPRSVSFSLALLAVVLRVVWILRRRLQPRKALSGPQDEEKVVFFVRHGEAQHNVGMDFSIPDPVLTPRGEEQSFSLKANAFLAAALSDDARWRAQLLVVSPLRRTVQTAALGFGGLAPWLLEPDIQEANAFPCDTASPELGAALLRELRMPELLAQYEALPEGWCRKEGAYAPGKELLLARFRRFTDRLRHRPEASFVVVTHDHVLKAGLGLQTKFANGEVRA
eukprot:CAMPEP_0168358606 /NCGR_PEP_ID=MMETSP0228-20121227/1206_1 /TAXON_ID=133427 /ORGANISM="Protoceratium reticulatum, Strain CCCM 535 (=CCMP 1889)" /LENGTH=235 /DNA_ID=CAMNT_0008371195 /DNA_START=55 /DNA_END=759 /DNA_ORIENTATION=-